MDKVPNFKFQTYFHFVLFLINALAFIFGPNPIEEVKDFLLFMMFAEATLCIFSAHLTTKFNQWNDQHDKGN